MSAAAGTVVATLTARADNGTETMEFVGYDRDAVREAAAKAWGAIDQWLRGPLPVAYPLDNDLWCARVTRRSAE